MMRVEEYDAMQQRDLRMRAMKNLTPNKEHTMTTEFKSATRCWMLLCSLSLGAVMTNLVLGIYGLQVSWLTWWWVMLLPVEIPFCVVALIGLIATMIEAGGGLLDWVNRNHKESTASTLRELANEY